MIRFMENKTSIDILEEQKRLARMGLDYETYKEQPEKLNEELEKILKKVRKKNQIISVISFVACLFVVCLSAIANFSYLAMKDELTEKNVIIQKYEQIVHSLGTNTDSEKLHGNLQERSSSTEIVNEKYRMLEKISDLESKIKLIKKQYDISVINDGKSYYLKANKVDSALLLLDVYRDKIHFDSKKNEWIVVR